MEAITLDNYEAYFLDYHEGNLSAEDVAELMLFLEKHPELKDIFGDFEIIPIGIEANKTVFEGKEGLKKTKINTSNYEEYLIASVENILDEKDRKELRLFLNVHPELQKELDMFQRTLIIPDLSIVFPDKEKLKKRKGLIIRFPSYPYIAAAASLALLLGVWFFSRPNADDTHSLIPVVSFVPGKHDSMPAPGNKQGNETNVQVSNTPERIKKDIAKGIEKNRDNKGAAPHALLAEEITALKSAHVGELPNPVENSLAMNMNALPALTESIDAPESGKITVPSLPELAAERIRTTLTGTETPIKENKYKGWMLAKVAVKGYNRLTGRKINIKENYDEHGILVSYALQGGGFGYQKSTGEQ